MADFKKILIANRGEIAIRVMRAANELGKRTVAVYAEEDKLSLHRFKADEAYKVGGGLGPVQAYLSVEEIIRVAKMSGADAVHPGYGLLSENPDLVDACTAAGIAFIGPKAETMRALGDKASARRVAIEAGVPVIPATEVLGVDMTKIARQAEEVGYPLMLKASWGGGGRGMRPILSPDELEEKVREGRREAEAAFGNGEGYLEKMSGRAMSRCRSSGTFRETSTISGSATARCSAGPRRSSCARRRPIFPRPSARKSATSARRSPKPWTTSAPARSSS